MPVLPNPRQERFCLEYVKSGHAGVSALRAAMGEPVDPEEGRLALANPVILARIEELRGPLEAAILTPLERKARLSAIVEHKPAPEKVGAFARIAAIAELNKMGGDYAPEKHVIASRVLFEVVYRGQPPHLVAPDDPIIEADSPPRICEPEDTRGEHQI